MSLRNKTEYKGLELIEPTGDNKRMVFRFSNGTAFTWCVFDYKFYHENGNVFAACHFKNIMWGCEEDSILKPGHPRFFDILGSRAKTGWIQTYFAILKKYIQNAIKNEKHRVANVNHGGEPHTKRFERKINSLVTMTDGLLVAPIESLAKNNFVGQMNIDRLCDQVLKNGRVLSYTEMKSDGLDAWFMSHVSEGVHPQYVRTRNRYGDAVDAYADDVTREYILGNYIPAYRMFVAKGHGDVFRYVWEKYKFVLSVDDYYFRQWAEKLNAVVKWGYDQKRLMDYIFRDLPAQGICPSMTDHTGLDELYDYVKMSVEMNCDYEKYPKYLKTFHDVATKNYEVKKSTVLNNKYEQVKESNRPLEFENKKFAIVSPESLGSIVQEGASLNHCVKSYIEGVVNGEWAIMFMRLVEEKSKSMVTVQVKDGRVLQCRGQNNRDTTEEEALFLDEYRGHLDSLAKQKELVLGAA